MSRKSPDLTIEEAPGDLYASLAAAQRAALKPTARDLAAILRSLLADGVLVQREGKIVPK